MKTGKALYQGALLGILGIAVLGSTIALSRPDYTFFDPIIDVERIIAQRFVSEPDRDAMRLAAINGMVDSLNDPYTVYIPPTLTRSFTKDLTGDFVGIGVQVGSRDGVLTVVTPLEDTPAFRAGVLANDRIIEINGTSTVGLSPDQCVELLTGEPGTEVTFVVDRDGQKLPFTVTRERIVAKTVKGFHWEAPKSSDTPATAPDKPDGQPAADASKQSGSWQSFIDPTRKIAYIRLTQFTPTSADEITSTLESLGAREGKVGGLILDLRFNPGGVLADAIEIADLFLKEGVIVSTKGRAHEEDVARAVADGTLPDFPLALLVNGNSASASEVLSGALAENKRAVVVGTRTFGKGLVQSVLSLPSGQGQLKITEQKYYLPSGRSIQRDDASAEWGVDPTPGFFLPMNDDETAEFLRVRRQEEVIGGDRHAGNEDRWSDPAWIVDRLKDKQLAAALKAVQLKIDSGSTGNWTPTGEPLPSSPTLASGELTRVSKLRDRLERELVRLSRRIEQLESAAGTPAAEAPDLWPDETDLSGGSLDIFDKAGKRVARLSITGPDLERWLAEADIKPETNATEPGAPASAPKP
ncbi:MAG: S41 family peptidase [Phycisphaerales bacterium]